MRLTLKDGTMCLTAFITCAGAMCLPLLVVGT